MKNRSFFTVKINLQARQITSAIRPEALAANTSRCDDRLEAARGREENENSFRRSSDNKTYFANLDQLSFQQRQRSAKPSPIPSGYSEALAPADPNGIESGKIKSGNPRGILITFSGSTYLSDSGACQSLRQRAIFGDALDEAAHEK
jgi:hypothetical protein